MAEPETYTLTLKGTGSGPPTIIRIRRALKYLLRACGLRCVAISEVKPGESDER